MTNNWNMLMSVETCHRNIVQCNQIYMDLVCFYDDLKQDVIDYGIDDSKKEYNHVKLVENANVMVDEAIDKLTECKQLMNVIFKEFN